MKKNLLKKYLPIIGIDILGNFLLAIAVSFFFINYHGVKVYSGSNETFNGLLTGGTAGFSLILQALFHISEGHVELIITIVTWVLFIIGSIFLGKKFAIQTLFSTILYPIFLFFFKLSIFNNIRMQVNEFDPLLCAIIGGGCMGYGCGIIYRVGGSTGGFDVPGLIINKFTRIKLSKIFLFTDGLLVVLSFIAKFTLYEVTIGLVAVIAYSIVVDYAQLKGTRSYLCEIISDKWEDINREILALDRGTTIIDVKGGYTGKDRKMIKTMVSKNQYLSILDIVKKYDENAFMSMHQTSDVFGEGYRDIKDFLNK